MEVGGLMRQASLTFYSLYPHIEVPALFSLYPFICLHISLSFPPLTVYLYTDKKNKNFIIYKEIEMGSVQSHTYMRKGFLIYEKMCKFFSLYEKPVSHI
jgi:hypothetical protein